MIGVLLTNGLINLAEVIGFAYDGRDSGWAVVAQQTSHCVVYLCICLFTMLLAAHFGRVIEVRGGSARIETIIAGIISLVNITGVIVSRVFGFYFSFDEAHHYVRLSTYPIFIAICELALLPILVMVLRNRRLLRKKEFIAFLTFVILVSLGGVLQLIFTRMSLFNLTNSVGLLIVLLIHELEYSDDTVRRERQLSLARIHAYESQIQPHFIYNSLTAIRSQLPPDSEAVETLNHFAGFLRGTIDVMNEGECISFKHELKTVEHYLFLEKTRFGDKLTVEMDIRDTDFELPAFTLQLLVENAIRHGIREKADGRGTVSIAAYKTKDAHFIEVKDDGVGFDIGALDISLSAAEMLQRETAANGIDSDLRGKSAGVGDSLAKDEGDEPEDSMHQSVGLINLNQRLHLMCGGSLVIESVIGKGTEAWVRIPMGGY